MPVKVTLVYVYGEDEDAGGEIVVDKWEKLIGLRKLDVRGRQIRINEKLMRFAGVNRHDNFFLNEDPEALYEGLSMLRVLHRTQLDNITTAWTTQVCH